MRFNLAPYVITAVTSIGILILAAPLILTVLLSFDPRNYLAYNLSPQLTAKWYTFFFSYPMFVDGLKTSLLLSSLATAVSLSLGVPGAFALSRSAFKGRNMIQTFLLSPIVMPGVILGVGLLTFFSQIVKAPSGFTNLLVAHIIITFPFALRSVTASLLGLDRSVEESSMSLGANEIRTFFKITLPLIRPGIVSGGVFAFALSFSDVATSVFLTGPYAMTLPVAILVYLKSYFNPSIAAASVIMIALSLIWLVIVEKTFGVDRFVGTKIL